MYKKVFLLTAIIFLNACSTSQVNFQNDQLMIQSGGNSTFYDGQLIAKYNENFSTLFIDQKILQLPQGNLIVYEYAHTDLQYEFEPGLPRIMQIVFDARQSIPVYIGSQLSAYQIALPNGQWLNILAQQSNTQDIYFIYGMSTAQFNKMLKKIDPNAPLAPHQVMQLNHRQKAIQSRWTMQKVHFVPLVVPFQVSMRY